MKVVPCGWYKLTVDEAADLVYIPSNLELISGTYELACVSNTCDCCQTL